MILRERMHLSATPDRICAVLADPALMELWNPRCVRYQADGSLVHVGLRHRAIFPLQPPGGRTEVTRDADFTHSGLRWRLGVFMKVLGVFGRRRGRLSLDGVAEMVERLSKQTPVRKRTWQKSVSRDV